MPEMNRRQAIGAGAGALAASAFGDTASAAGGGTGPADDDAHPHVFRLTRSAANNYPGGSLRGANQETFPILTGQNASVYFVHLDVGGIREPHWHPTAWELNFVVSGTTKWTILGTHPSGSYTEDTFQVEQGDLVFIPTGFFHYFENASSTDPLEVLVVFNTSAAEPNDDIGIVGSLNSLPRDVLAAVFGVPASTFEQLPSTVKPVVIAKRG